MMIRKLKDRRDDRVRRMQESADLEKRKEQWESDHQNRLAVAAGIFSVTLVCHADTWDIARTVAFGPGGFVFPDGHAETDREGRVTARFSGPMLVTFLAGLREVIGTGGEWTVTAMMHFPEISTRLQWTVVYQVSGRVYEDIAAALKGITAGGLPGVPLAPIVIDQGVRTGTEAEEGQ